MQNAMQEMTAKHEQKMLEMQKVHEDLKSKLSRLEKENKRISMSQAPKPAQ